MLDTFVISIMTRSCFWRIATNFTVRANGTWIWPYFLLMRHLFQASRYLCQNWSPRYQLCGARPKVQKDIATRDATMNVDRHRVDFIAENPQYLHPDNSMDFLSDDSGETYNLCHCERIFSRRGLSTLTMSSSLEQL